MMTLTDRQRRFLAAVDDAIKNDGRVAAHRAVAPDGWFFPSDVWTGSTPIAAQLFLKGALERQNVGLLSTRYMYRRKPSQPAV